jgi:hypothetical protein
MTSNTGGDACISCGMPMRTEQEHAAADPAKPYCVHCATDSGDLKTYDEVLHGFTGFLRRTQGLHEEAARRTAADVLATRPAWSGR